MRGSVIATLGLFCLLAAGCSVTKYIPEGEYLYQGASIEVIAPDTVSTTELTAKLNAALRDRTNKKTPLIGYRKLWQYYRYQEKLATAEGKKLEKLEAKTDVGEEPIYYSESVSESVANLLENRAANTGFFDPEASFTRDTARNPPVITVKYDIAVRHPYFIDTVRHFWRDSSIASIIDSVSDNTLLPPDVQYDLDRVKGERSRWEQALREQGYYYSRADDFLFLADTVGGDHEVTMLAKLKDNIPPERLRPQFIRQINVYPNLDPADTLKRDRLPTFETGGLTIHCDECVLRPEIIDEAFAQQAGDRYDPDAHAKTLKRLANYKTFRYISMNYRKVPGSDSTLILDAFMQPLLRRRFEAEAGLTFNNANYVGPNLTVAYVNRNLLRGAELLRLEGDLDYAVFIGDQGTARVDRSASYGLKATLGVPRLWLPKRSKLIPRVITSGTTIQISAKFLNQSLNLGGFSTEIASQGLTGLAELLEKDQAATETLNLITGRLRYGYNWQRRITKKHELFPISIHFQDPVVSNEEVLTLARSQGLAGTSTSSTQGSASRYDRMLVFSPGYTLTFDSRLRRLTQHSFFFQQYLSMNWNNVFPVGRNLENSDPFTSLYPQVETDFRYYLTFSKSTQLATRLHGGVAFPISDRAVVPFFDLYTIGGPNSLRGFAPLQLGPGKTVPIQNNQLTSGGFGNLILESSVELRQRVNSLIELAAFIDVGNIWTYKTELEPLDTDFRRNNFIDELAMNYGFGVRLDLQFLILRLDLAKPFQVPYENAADGLQIPQANFITIPEKNWNFVLAFGYPF